MRYLDKAVGVLAVARLAYGGLRLFNGVAEWFSRAAEGAREVGEGVGPAGTDA